MGAYLSVANKAKESSDGENDKFRYGASAMQGWRTGMEDAHATVLDIDEDVSFFAVYDGHGGKEVAQYCSRHLHHELLKTPAYKAGDISQALITAYLRMDELMMLEDGRLELKVLAAKKGSDRVADDADDAGTPGEAAHHGDDMESEVTNGMSSTEAAQSDVNGKAVERELKGRENGWRSEGGGSERDDRGGANKKTKVEVESPQSQGASVVEVASGAQSLTLAERQQAGNENGARDERDARNGAEGQGTGTTGVNGGGAGSVEGKPLQAGVGNSTEPAGVVRKKEKDEALKEVEEHPDEDEDDDVDFVVEGEDDDDYWTPDEAPPEEGSGTYHGPVAGCTAVAAVVRGDDLVVANAGDSRCVISRNGLALELSRDHKPDLEDEKERILHAGGFVSDGRINGCLNLSRAIGDMEYKQNSNLEPMGQMVTAYPELRSIKLQQGDEFLVLACDGIWDVMTSQEVVDFVRKRLQPGRQISSICEELFENCVAPDRHGVGIGMDNMSAVVVLLKKLVSPRVYSDSRQDASEGSGG